MTIKATCSVEGVTSFTCSRCKDSYTEAIPTIPHNYANATCTDPQTCINCGATTGSENGHSWVDATCTKPKTCSVCKVTEGSTIAHNYQGGSCNTPGICTGCGKTQSAPGHNYVEFICTVCGEIDPDAKWSASELLLIGEYLDGALENANSATKNSTNALRASYDSLKISYANTSMQYARYALPYIEKAINLAKNKVDFTVEYTDGTTTTLKTLLNQAYSGIYNAGYYSLNTSSLSSSILSYSTTLMGGTKHLVKAQTFIVNVLEQLA